MADADLLARFHEFLKADRWGYDGKMDKMVDENQHRLLVDLHHLRSHDTELARGVVDVPREYLPAFEQALAEQVREKDPPAEYFKGDDAAIHIGLIGHLGANTVSPRTLTADFLTRVVCLEGIITKCSLVRPKMVRSVHYCPTTEKFTSREYRDATDWSEAGPTGTSYPTKDTEGNPLQMEFGLSTYKANQVVTIQEMPERAPLGQLPRSVDAVLNNDLVDKCKPGDRVQIVGVYRALVGASGVTSGVFRTVLLANSVRLLSKDIQGLELTEDDVRNIKKVAKRRDAFDLIARSLAPSIYGHEHLKKAVLLMLLGGRERVLENGTHLRGDINILMVGDPSTAKSQLLRFVLNIAPLAVNTTGRGSSGVGLTAAVTTDSETKERRLEAGAMVLADRGVVCIDEFDKMSDADRVAIHEVMEQQTVTIAKASIHATLNARCSVVAAANPIYGSYDKTLTPQRNVNLPDSLLSRFDLLFIVLDELDKEKDSAIANHVLRMHRYERPNADKGAPFPLDAGGLGADDDDDEEEMGAKTSRVNEKFNPLLHAGVAGKARRGRRPELLTMDFIKKFVHYAKNRITPQLTDEARELISNEYRTLRQKADTKTLPITPRTLETLIRISTAHAKSRLSEKIQKRDVEAAVAVLKYAMYHEAEPVAKKKKGRKRLRDADADDAGTGSDSGSSDDSGDEDMGAGAGAGTGAGSGSGGGGGSSGSRSRSRSRSRSARRARAAAREATPAGAGAVLDDDDDDKDVDMAPSPAKARRTTRSSPASSGRGSRGGSDAEEPDSDMSLGSDGAAGGDAALAAAEAAAASITVDGSSARYAVFGRRLAWLFRTTRESAHDVRAVLEAVNSGRGDEEEFSLAEACAILKAMQTKNRVLYSKGRAYQL